MLIFRNVTYYVHPFIPLIQICGFRVYFFKDYWNLLDLFIVSLSAVDIVLDLAAAGSLGSFPPSLLKVAKIFRVLRMGRVLKLIKVLLIPTNFSLINLVLLLFRNVISSLIFV